MVTTRSLAGSVAVVAFVAACGGGGGGNTGQTDRTLTVTTAGSGTGTVTSAPGGISCTSGSASGCSAPFSQNASVTLSAAPAAGSTFAGWSGGACNGQGTCQVVLAGDLTIQANFDPVVQPVQHTLTVTLTGSGSGRVTSSPAGIDCTSGKCSASFTEGTTVTLTAAPGGSSTLVSWGGACSGAASTCSVGMSGDEAVTANFGVVVVNPQWTLSVSTFGSGTGKVTSSPAGISCASGSSSGCSAVFDAGTVILTASGTVAGSVFTGWTGACAAEVTATCTLTLSADTSTVAHFKQQRMLTIGMLEDGTGTVTSVPAGISCTTGSQAGCSAWFDPGVPITVTAAPAAGTTFLGWGDPCSGTITPCTVTLQSNDWGLTADFSAWIVHRPFPTNLYAAAKLGTTLLAVGDTGAWLTSTDGLAWTGHERPGTPALRGVAAGSTAAVAVGDGGTILTTTDGGSWTAQTSGTASNLRAVAYGGGTFVAVGAAGTVLWSSDGSAWTVAGSVTSRDLLAVAYGGGTFVAAGYGGTILTSPDGQTWTSQDSKTVNRLSGVAFGPAGFVAVGDIGTVTTSANGSSWTLQGATGTSNLIGVTALPASNYVAMDDQKRALVSATGASWALHGADAGQGAGPAVALGSDLYALGQGGGIAHSTDGSGWSLVLAAHAGFASFSGAAWGNGRYVVVGDGAIFSSPDGASWTSRRAGTNELVTSVAFGAGAFVAVSSAGLLTSADGDVWASTAAPPAPYGGVVRYAAGKFVVVAANGGDTQVRTSPDGSTWTAQPTVVGAALYSLAYGGSNFIALGDAGYVYSNADPTAAPWILETQLAASLETLTYGNGTFVGIDGTTGFASYTSPTGIGSTWTSHSSASYLMPILTFGNGVFRASGTTSTDGATWNSATSPTVPGENVGYVTPLDAAVYGGPAGWVAAKHLSVNSGGGIAFASHP